MYEYNIFGKLISCPEALLPPINIQPIFDSGESSIKISLEDFLLSEPLDWFMYSTDSHNYYLQWQNIADIKISFDGKYISVSPKSNFSKDIFYSYLLTQIVAFCLTLSGQEVLHSTGIRFNNLNYFFLGDGGSGKSTLAARILKRGGKLITDDILVTTRQSSGKYFAYRGLPRLKLYPDSVAAAELEFKNTIHLSPYTKKVLGILDKNNLTSQELSSIDKLIVISSKNVTTAKNSLVKLQGREAILATLHNTFNTLDRRPERLASQFHFVSSFLKNQSLFELSYERDINKIDDLIDYLFKKDLHNEISV